MNVHLLSDDEAIATVMLLGGEIVQRSWRENLYAVRHPNAWQHWYNGATKASAARLWLKCVHPNNFTG